MNHLAFSLNRFNLKFSLLIQDESKLFISTFGLVLKHQYYKFIKDNEVFCSIKSHNNLGHMSLNY